MRTPSRGPPRRALPENGSPVRNLAGRRRRSILERLAGVAFGFLTMNCSAVAGLLSAITGRKVWR
jgi:hypothetical protein